SCCADKSISYTVILNYICTVAPPTGERPLSLLSYEYFWLLTQQVVFSASLLSDGLKAIGPFNTHTALVFKHVLTNIGSAYDPTTGVFTAPLTGAYHFEWHIGVHGSNTAAVLVKNTNHIFTAVEQQESGYGSSSQGAALRLEAGDDVSLHLWANNSIYDNQNHVSTFSGHLLFTV
uniref:C1q domain-containing protein n=1 Tax=Seriola lalandi dorsalis TaxID=1841481 RepID=A0A3B4WPG1_SERLL